MRTLYVYVYVYVSMCISQNENSKKGGGLKFTHIIITKKSFLGQSYDRDRDRVSKKALKSTGNLFTN